jgi:hypothetical protein
MLVPPRHEFVLRRISSGKTLGTVPRDTPSEVKFYRKKRRDDEARITSKPWTRVSNSAATTDRSSRNRTGNWAPARRGSVNSKRCFSNGAGN